MHWYWIDGEATSQIYWNSRKYKPKDNSEQYDCISFMKNWLEITFREFKLRLKLWHGNAHKWFTFYVLFKYVHLKKQSSSNPARRRQTVYQRENSLHAVPPLPDPEWEQGPGRPALVDLPLTLTALPRVPIPRHAPSLPERTPGHSGVPCLCMAWMWQWPLFLRYYRAHSSPLLPVKLQLQAEERGVVSIKGVCANRYLAMKEDGRLLASVSSAFWICGFPLP